MRSSGVHTCGVSAAGEEAQDGWPGAQRPGHHHGYGAEGTRLARGRRQRPAAVTRVHVCVPAVRVCVPAVPGQRLRRPQEDLHPPAGLRFTCVPLTGCVRPLLAPHLPVFQVNGKSLSLKQYLEEPSSLSMVSAVPAGTVGGSVVHRNTSNKLNNRRRRL